MLIVLAVLAFHDLAALEAQAAAATGTPVTIDRRLRLAACPAPTIVRGAGGVAIACADPPWRIGVAAPPAIPLIRRGDAVSVVAAGEGFAVTVDGIAEGDAIAGARVRVKSAGGHLTAIVGFDGVLTAMGYKSN